MSARPPIRILDATGSPGDIGRAHGNTFADEIRVYTAERVGLVASGLWSGGPLSEADVLAIAESMLPAHEDFDADVHTELIAMAEAAGITAAEAVIVGGFTDFIDTVRAIVGGDLPKTLVEDDCTAVIVPDSRAGGAGFLGQTWDMHDTATDHVLLLRIHPDNAPSARVFTTTGCVGQIGMNSEGLCVGINNLTGLDGQPGVTWTSVVRGMLKATTADEALEILSGAKLAGAHNYLILDRHGNGYNVEAMPSARPVTKLTDRPLVHTNHTIDAAASAVQVTRDPPLLASSSARLETAIDLLTDGEIDIDRLIALTREPDVICQKASEPYHIESSGAAIMRPKTDEFWACWGRPTENDFHTIEAPGS